MVYSLMPTRKVLETIEQAPIVPSFFLDNFFGGGVVLSIEEEIDFEQVYREKRKLAPFVAPFAKGAPAWEKGSRTYKFKPGSIKQFDTYDPSRAIVRAIGHKLDLVPPTPAENYRSWVSEALELQYRKVQRTWEWMASQAVLNATCTFNVKGFEQPIAIDFGRAANQTITLAGADLWTAGTNNILGNIGDWGRLMNDADFGGKPTKIIMGSKAYDAFSKDTKVQAQLNTQLRGTDSTFNTAVKGMDAVEYMGMISGIPVYLYSDYYHDDTGTKVDFMDSRDILLVGNINGLRGYGMIQDIGANFQAIPFYGRNSIIDGEDQIPFVNSKSCPIFVPMNQNASLRARVVA